MEGLDFCAADPLDLFPDGFVCGGSFSTDGFSLIAEAFDFDLE